MVSQRGRTTGDDLDYKDYNAYRLASCFQWTGGRRSCNRPFSIQREALRRRDWRLRHAIVLVLQLKSHGIHKLIVTGLIAHTCVEATVRFAAELGCPFGEGCEQSLG